MQSPNQHHFQMPKPVQQVDMCKLHDIDAHLLLLVRVQNMCCAVQSLIIVAEKKTTCM
jgi:hypothetical protein